MFTKFTKTIFGENRNEVIAKKKRRIKKLKKKILKLQKVMTVEFWDKGDEMIHEVTIKVEPQIMNQLLLIVGSAYKEEHDQLKKEIEFA